METVILFLANVALPYVVMSLACMVLVESLAAAMNLRGRTLRKTIRDMLQSRERTDLFYGHPLIGPSRRGNRYPSYVPVSLFVVVAADLIRAEGQETSLRAAAAKISGDLGRSLRALFSGVAFGAEPQALAFWFLTVADETSGAYRAKVSQLLFATAAILVVSLNLDALAIAQYTNNQAAIGKSLETDAAARREPAEAATGLMRPPPENTNGSSPGAGPTSVTKTPAGAYPLPIGWDFDDERSLANIHLKVVGLLASILFIVAGAPLLFDTLNRFMVVRFDIKPFDGGIPLPPAEPPVSRAVPPEPVDSERRPTDLPG